MTTHRFFLPDAVLVPGQPVDLTPLARQLARVLRLHAGAEIHLLGQPGITCFLTALRCWTTATARARCWRPRTMLTASRRRLTLYQCSLKADKFEWVLQKGTELGVAGLCRWSACAAWCARWQRWPRKPTAGRPSSVRRPSRRDGRACPRCTRRSPLTPPYAMRPGCASLPWEEADGHCRVWANWSGGRPGRWRCSSARKAASRPGEAALDGDGWQPVTLGPHVLRAETAALAAVTIALDRLDELTRASRN
ncbi:MAG: 16S rRNA (uracil(1498)-N(3))-methyltransferase [Caldilineaceae bacterium]